MIALIIIALLLFAVMVLDIVLRFKRGFGIWGKHFDEDFWRFENRIDYIIISLIFLFVVFTLTTDTNARNELFEFFIGSN